MNTIRENQPSQEAGLISFHMQNEMFHIREYTERKGYLSSMFGPVF